MNDRWLKGGKAWNRPEKQRAARLFRGHVFTPSNPLGRIVRRPCFFCVLNAARGGYPRLEHLPDAPAHHIDYDRPFVIVWCCDSHHRQIDHGSLRIPARAICDYTSLIDAPGVGRRGGRVPRPRGEPGGDVVPFADAHRVVSKALEQTFEAGVKMMFEQSTTFRDIARRHRVR